jgi:O-antigen/teichoic acid export membrane protein
LARIILGGFSLLIIIAVALFSQKPPDVKWLLILLGTGMFTTNLFGSYSAVLMGFERFKAYGAFSALYSLGVVLLSLLALKIGLGLVGIGVGQLLTSLVVTISGILFVTYKVLSPRGGINFSGSLGVLKAAAPLGLASVLITIYYRADFVMLSYMRGDIEVGYYGAAYTIINTLLLFAGTFSGSLLPRLSNLFVNDSAALARLYGVAFKYLLFVGIGAAFGAMILADPIMQFLFGEDYLPGGAALSILIWASALMFVNSLQGTLLVASDLRRQLVYLTGTAAGVNLLLNLFLIPAYGIRGAAAATVSAEIIAGVWSFALNRKYHSSRDMARALIGPLAAAIIMSIVLLLLPTMHVLYRIILGIITYLACLIIFKGLGSRDFDIIRDMIGGGRQASN